MTIALTTPHKFTPHGGSEQSYGEVKIINWSSLVEPAEDAGITITLQYGDTVDGAWNAGQAPTHTVTIADSKPEHGTAEDGTYVETVARGAQYSGWVAANAELYSNVAATLYQWLLDNAGLTGST